MSVEKIMFGGREVLVRRPCCRRRAERPARVRWLGIRWIGVPFPKRIRVRIYIVPAAGCGCIYALKVLWLRLKRKS